MLVAAYTDFYLLSMDDDKKKEFGNGLNFESLEFVDAIPNPPLGWAYYLPTVRKLDVVQGTLQIRQART